LPAVANDPDRLARFTREARILASISHPNIALIHGIADSNGIRVFVMELIDGPTLSQRIAQGPVPLPEALAIARQIDFTDTSPTSLRRNGAAVRCISRESRPAHDRGAQSPGHLRVLPVFGLRGRSVGTFSSTPVCWRCFQ
jgi:serine/threonine protein kinase